MLFHHYSFTHLNITRPGANSPGVRPSAPAISRHHLRTPSVFGAPCYFSICIPGLSWTFFLLKICYLYIYIYIPCVAERSNYKIIDTNPKQKTHIHIYIYIYTMEINSSSPTSILNWGLQMPSSLTRQPMPTPGCVSQVLPLIW